MCQESLWIMEGSGGGPLPPSESSWSQTVYTLGNIASKYDDTNLPKYLFVHQDYSDEAIGLNLSEGDLLEVFGFHCLPCVSGVYDAGQQGLQCVSIPLTYQGKVRKLPKCEYQFPNAQDLVRHFPKFVRVTYAPRPRDALLGLGEVLELVKADQDVLHVKRNGENLTIPLDYRGDFEEIMFKDSTDYDLRTLVTDHLCPCWVQLTEMKRIREGFTGFKHFSGEVKLNYVMDEKFLLCRIVKDKDSGENQDDKVEVMCIPVETACRLGTSPTFKVPTGILKHSQRVYSAVPDWDLDQLHSAVKALNFVTNHNASLHTRKFIADVKHETADSESTSSSVADAPKPTPIPPPRRRKQLKATLPDGDSCRERTEAKSTISEDLHSLEEFDRVVSGPMDNNFNYARTWKTKKERPASGAGKDEKHGYVKSVDSRSGGRDFRDTPPPTPPRIDLDARPSPPPPVPQRPISRPVQSGPPLPPQSSKPNYVSSKTRIDLPPELPSSHRANKPSMTDQVPPPMADMPTGYLSMSGLASEIDDDSSNSNYLNDSFDYRAHPRPPSPNPSADGKMTKDFSGPITELDRRAWETEVLAEVEVEDMYIVAHTVLDRNDGMVDYDEVPDIHEEEEYLSMTFRERISPQAPSPAPRRPPALPPRIDRGSASITSNSSTATVSSGYNSDTPEVTVHSVSDISSVPNNVACLSVSALADSLSLFRLEHLAETCREHIIDGCMFARLTAEDLRGDPFNLNGFYLKKALMFKDEGWTPKLK